MKKIISNVETFILARIAPFYDNPQLNTDWDHTNARDNLLWNSCIEELYKHKNMIPKWRSE